MRQVPIPGPGRSRPSDLQPTYLSKLQPSQHKSITFYLYLVRETTNYFSGSQFGFRNGRSTRDAIYVLTQAIDFCLEPQTEGGLPEGNLQADFQVDNLILTVAQILAHSAQFLAQTYPDRAKNSQTQEHRGGLEELPWLRKVAMTVTRR